MTTTTTKTDTIKLIERAYNVMDQQNSFRSFLSIGRDALQADWFSARGIPEKFDIHYATFFKNFFTEESNFYAGRLFEENQLQNFADALKERLNGSLSAQPKVHGEEIIEARPEHVRAERKQVNGSFNLLLPLDEMIQAAVENQIEESGVLKNIEQRIKEEAAKLRPNLIQISDRKPVAINGKLHIAFTKALRNCTRYRQTFISGPAGTGKTTLARQVAQALELPYGHISCTAGMSEAHLLGRMDAHGNYLPSEFITLYENGGVFLFDEIDAADSNTMLIINSALANGHMSVPNRKDKPFANRHKDFYCIGAANTWGFGSNEYAGRNILDAATLDRFAGSQLFVDYDKELEKEISKEFPEVARTIWKIRENVKANRIRRVVSTRAIANGVIALTDGDALGDYVNDFTTAWTEEEKKKALHNIY